MFVKFRFTFSKRETTPFTPKAPQIFISDHILSLLLVEHVCVNLVGTNVFTGWYLVNTIDKMGYQNSHHCKLNFDLIGKEELFPVCVEAKTEAQPTRNLERCQWRARCEPITGKSARSNQKSEAVCVLES